MGVCLVVLFMAPPVFARTLYVSDQLAVNLRSEAVSGSAAQKLMHTDDAMQMLGEKGDYFKVRLSDGTEGYFPKRYATDREPRTHVISRLEKQLKQLEGELTAAQKRLGAASGELEAERQQLVEKLAVTEKKLTDIQQQQTETLNERDATLQKYDQLVVDAADVVTLASERDRLKDENAMLSNELGLLRKENESLMSSGVIKWFLAGAGVLFLGWLIGRASRRKRGGLSGGY
ncbi:MAG: hypothetical protein C0624_00560 [Desulfuromonas sp.]|nr:MAG: hypothetical protein C0624_00560 [Desulfuromonas sp.]